VHYPTRAEDRAEWARRIGEMDAVAEVEHLRYVMRECRDAIRDGNDIWALGKLEVELLRVASSAKDAAFSKTVWAPKPERY
jgi:hypothetical protein